MTSNQSNPSDSSELDEILITLAGHTLAENRKKSSEVKMSPLISKTKAQILSRYRSVEEIKEAVGTQDYITKYSGNSRLDQEVQSRIDGANKLRQEILSALGIEEAKL